MFDCMTHFVPAWNTTPHCMSPNAALNCSHPTLIAVCYSTSPSWRVQRSSPGDWSSPQLIFAGWNAERGPSVQVCVRAAYTQNTVPIDYCYVPCCKGRARFLLFWSVAETRLCCCHGQHSKLHQKTRATSPVFSWSGKIWRTVSGFFKRIMPHERSPGLFIQATIYTNSQLPGKACMTFRWKTHFSEKKMSKIPLLHPRLYLSTFSKLFKPHIIV